MLGGEALAAVVAASSLTSTLTSSSSATLRWTDTNTAEKGYNVERSTRAKGGFKRLKALPANTTSYSDTGLAPGTTYTYRITTTSSSRHSNVASVTTPIQGNQPTPAPTAKPTPTPKPTATPSPAPTADKIPPSVPGGLSGAASGCTQVNLSWKASADTGGSGLQGYRVFRNGAAIMTNPTVSATDTGVTGGSAYSYSVAAIDNAGNQSGTSTAFVLNTPPCEGSDGPWAKRIGGAGSELPQAVAVDAAGNIVVVGEIRGAANLGGGTLSSAGGIDLFIAKYSASGAHLWSKRFGGSDDESASAVAIDGEGSIFVGGYFRGSSVDLGGGRLVNVGPVATSDGFIAKFSSAGQHLWSSSFGGTDADAANGLAIDPSGDVIAVGVFKGAAVDFNGTTLASTWGGPDTFVVKLSGEDGASVWAKNVNCGGPDTAKGVAVDRSGNVFVVGEFAGNADFGSGSFLTTAGFNDVYLAKYSSSGAYVWAKRFGDQYSDTAGAVAVDASGTVSITGSFLGSVSFGGATLTAKASAGDIFVAHYTGSGAHVWSKNFGNAYTNYGLGIATDDDGNVIVTGTYYGTINLGGGTLENASPGYQEVFVGEFSRSGAHLWSQHYGGTNTDQGHGVGVGPNGPVVVGYFLSDSIDFGGGTVTNAGGVDGFVLSLGQ